MLACHRGGIVNLCDLLPPVLYINNVSSLFDNCLYIKSEGVSKVNVSLVYKVRDSKSLMIDKTYSIRLEFRNINESKK
jgi:hypothetical protein